ncbi:DUF1491 family protein [Qipengyuania spongiae]|uniref:DUF1491 family protein n=1 Tax=Qipengyuania spongiae TaxID=2909673 RepID=A0ABY5T3W5_9SPHN|nr:DUF1491 family protein [Qipengyuania spongiae]UVI39996.1 DUF1491 family protein [Qipengyuania spongiae]
MDARLPAYLEVQGMIRSVESAGGFATVVHKGERDAGTILILTSERGGNARFWERMPQLDGSRKFTCVREQHSENPQEFSEYLDRRGRQDPDSWLVELEIANPERFIAGGVN